MRPYRINLLGSIMALAACVILGRLVELQLLRGDELRARGESQHKRSFTTAAPRGAILDRNGQTLAISLETRSLYANPRKLEHPARIAEVLGPILGLPAAKIERLLRTDRHFVFVDRFLEPEQVEALAATDLPIGRAQPLAFLPSSKRYYPRGSLGVHVVGFSNVDGGLEGLELSLESELRGEPVKHLVFTDRSNNLLQTLGRERGEPAKDVRLTLDATIQHRVERELDRAMRETGALAASAILIDTTTGELLAMANRPAFDPREYSTSRPHYRRNLSVVAQYEPGSTFKVFPMAAALESGHVAPEDRFDCEQGRMLVGRRLIRDAKPLGILSASEVISKSSNIGMIKITRMLEPAEMRSVILDFGFGSPTGIELPGEIGGSVPKLSRWTRDTQASISFGHGIAVTPLQMVSGLATIANDGIRIPPRVVDGFSYPEGGYVAAPRGRRTRVITSGTARRLARMLEGTVRNGTGTLAQIDGYRIAGKSGTAQKVISPEEGYSEEDYYASFGGFGPVSNPRVAALVVLDRPVGPRHQGGQVAAPVFRRMMEFALMRLRVPGDAERAPMVQIERSPSKEEVPS